ncbi:hypothetical protein V7S57_21695 [Caulobacter sp. CCNWLY153]|uniref:hypothetical protein n=1 Tax=unclassified Caulobacter TaxID=2648921 RepID=UPI002FF3B3B7
MAKLSPHPLVWMDPDRRWLYRAVLVLTDRRSSPLRWRVARHALLEDLEIHDDPFQGANAWIRSDELDLVVRLGELLAGDADPGQVRAVAGALRARLESNGPGRTAHIGP